MHRLVLEDAEHRLGAIEQRIARSIQILAREDVEHAGVRFIGELRERRLADGQPRRLRRRVWRFVRIDAPREQRLEARVDARVGRAPSSRAC